MIGGSLFAGEFLAEGIRELPEWKQARRNLESGLEVELREIREAFPAKKGTSEQVTKDEFIGKVLFALGWTDSLREQSLSASDVPDGLLFPAEAAKVRALGVEDESFRYQLGDCFVEAKRWARARPRGCAAGGAGDAGAPLPAPRAGQDRRGAARGNPDERRRLAPLPHRGPAGLRRILRGAPGRRSRRRAGDPLRARRQPGGTARRASGSAAGFPEGGGTRYSRRRMGELARELRSRVEGEVRFDRATRILYSNDASIYQIEPTGVVIPRHTADVAETLRACSAAGAPVLPRGGGTSLAGQAVGEALILDLSVHFRSVLEVNREEMWARVQPGVVQDAFGAALAPLGLRFGPETSTSNRANLGGMIGNNSAGARSLVYGKTVDNVLDATVVLPDGSCERLAWMSWADIRRRARENGALARVLRELLALRDEFADEIRTRFPRIPRRVSGYNLDVLLDPAGVNLAHLVVGSEGTLGTVVEARVKLHRLPPAVGLAVLHFDGLLPALEAGVVALDLGPTAVELVDRLVLRLARESLEYSRRLGFVEGEPGALILVEFAGQNRGEVVSRLDDLERRLGARGRPLLRMLDPAAQRNVWQVRKAALPLLLSLPGDRKPIAFVEDTAVEPARLPEFIDRFEEILAGRDTEGSFYAHAGAGCLHIRPLINLKDPDEIRKMDTLAREVCDLVLDFGGAMSGEHGDGLARSHFNRRVFGPRVYEAFRRLKAAFDPAGIMNPGKVVNAPAMTENLRYGAGYRAAELPVVFPYRRENGFAGAVELCNGAGVCRKELAGTMCPSFMVTREEEHSTRGRANLLRALLDGRLAPGRESEDRVREALDLCLSCKACKAECPSGVDMARLKADFLHRYYRRRRRPLADFVFGAPDAPARWASRLGPLPAWLARRGWTSALLARTVGFDRRRSLPPFARRPFHRWFAESAAASQPSAPRSEVALFPDTFTNWYEPRIGIAACQVLWALGYRVTLAPAVCCGRPAISRGLLGRARRLARRSVRALGGLARAGTPILGLEPSCLFGFRDEIPELVPPAERPAARRLAEGSFLFDEFLARERDAMARLVGGRGEGSHALAHGHCHQKAFCGAEPLAGLLGTTGARITVADAGCCGMAGSFGYTADHYELSLAIGERRLLPAVRALPPEDAVVAAGTSCRHQILDTTSREALHPAEYLAQHLN